MQSLSTIKACDPSTWKLARHVYAAHRLLLQRFIDSPRLWQIEVLTSVDHLLRNEGKVLDHDGINAGDVRW